MVMMMMAVMMMMMVMICVRFRSRSHEHFAGVWIYPKRLHRAPRNCAYTHSNVRVAPSSVLTWTSP